MSHSDDTQFFYKKRGSAPSTKSFLVRRHNFGFLALKVS